MSVEHIEGPKRKVETFSKDQLILPKEPSPKTLRLLKRAEEVGLGGMFVSHWFSDVLLTQDAQVSGWNKKPEDSYWKRIEKGTISKDAAKLPGVEILIDRTHRPNYEKNGRQLHENDPLGFLLARLRKEKKISTSIHIPEASRFWVLPDPELTEVVLPEIAQLLEVDTSEVRLPTEIEFNILGNFIYRHFGDASTSEWLDDEFGDGSRLVGGNSGWGGLARVGCDWSDSRSYGVTTFRPLVVVSPEA